MCLWISFCPVASHTPGNKDWKKVKVLVPQPCVTLCDPMNCSPPGSSLHGIFQTRILEWVAIHFSTGIFPAQDRNQVSCIAGEKKFFTSWATRNHHIFQTKKIKGAWILPTNYLFICFSALVYKQIILYWVLLLTFFYLCSLEVLFFRLAPFSCISFLILSTFF